MSSWELAGAFFVVFLLGHWFGYWYGKWTVLQDIIQREKEKLK